MAKTAAASKQQPKARGKAFISIHLQNYLWLFGVWESTPFPTISEPTLQGKAKAVAEPSTAKSSADVFDADAEMAEIEALVNHPSTPKASV